MKRATRAAKAQETLEILERGSYILNNRVLELQQDIAYARIAAVLYRPDAFNPVMQHADALIDALQHRTVFTVLNTTVLDAASSMVQSAGRVGCLNFASAMNPGGGFLSGAQAQEESLAVSSALYTTQLQHMELYEHNRAQPTFLYSDYMIYSPDVPVFRDDSGALLEQPYKLSIITSPAVNVGAMNVSRPQELALVEKTMLQRMDRVLALFLHHGIRRLLLGAWGCGVFRNDPAAVAAWFASYLKDGKYAACFEEVVFAVYDRSSDRDNISAFEQIFSAS